MRALDDQDDGAGKSYIITPTLKCHLTVQRLSYLVYTGGMHDLDIFVNAAINLNRCNEWK
jgi:hypothetical protein